MFKIASAFKKSQLLIMLACVALVGIGGSLFPIITLTGRLNQSLWDDRKDVATSVVESAYAIAEGFHKQALEGKMSEDEAKLSAVAAIRHIRYQGSEYVWINDRSPKMIMHPIKPELEGQDVAGIKDPNGKALFVAMADLVKTSGEGFVDYMWAKPGHDEPMPKISFVKEYKPWNWILGSGVYVDDVEARISKERWQLLMQLSIILLIVAALSFFIVRSIRKPISSLTGTMLKLANGDKSVEIGYTRRADEIGDIARAVDVFKQNAIEMDRMREEQERQKLLAEEEKRRAMHALADSFDSSVRGVVNEVQQASTELDATAKSMSGIASNSQRQAATVASAAEEASVSVQTVASASEELSASIAEISRQVSQSAKVAQNAADKADNANVMMQGLSDAANKIGEVVLLITDIAAQTNLLALNATIEAARAGDAGKGFAVVAGEVKSLANQTAKATEEITRQISSVQTATNDAVDAIGGIAKVVAEVSQIASAISSAVEEQGAATQEIARNAQQASVATAEVTKNISGVAQGAQETGRSADDVQFAAGDMSKQANLLGLEVDKFLSNVRAA